VIPDEVLVDRPAAEEVLRIAKKAKIPFNQILLIYHLPEGYVSTSVRDALRSYQEKTVKIALEGLTSHLRFSDYSWIREQDYLILPFSEVSKLPSDILETIPGPGNLRVVIRDVDDPETAKSLSQRNLPRIEGKVLPTGLTFSSVLKIIQKK
jgi:hypothetical protein